MSSSKILVALDYPDAAQALEFVASVNPELCRLKVGKELFTKAGPDFVRSLVEQGFDVFLDLKFHDIPNTVNKAIASACELGVWMVNVHALGGREMLMAARDGVQSYPENQRPLLIAVSILTSMNQTALHEIGIEHGVQDMVLRLTQLSLQCGLDGMVCSAQEVSMLRQAVGEAPLFVTPGIRPVGASSDDQQRIMTPEKAIEAGSSYLVIGRPITQHANPAQELERINRALQSIQ